MTLTAPCYLRTLQGKIRPPIEQFDLESSATLKIFLNDNKAFDKFISSVKSVLPPNPKRMLDIGCGYGALTLMIKEALGIPECWGVDIDKERMAVAKQRGIKLCEVDMETKPLPFPDEYFDIIISFGVIEHLKYFDNLISEAHRTLRKEGVFVLSCPNLASYINRILLLLGYQPIDCEISNKTRTGLPNPILLKEVYGHLHAPTLKAIKQLLKHYGFTITKTLGLRALAPPYYNQKIALLTPIDKLFSKFPSLALRFTIIARRE